MYWLKSAVLVTLAAASLVHATKCSAATGIDNNHFSMVFYLETECGLGKTCEWQSWENVTIPVSHCYNANKDLNDKVKSLVFTAKPKNVWVTLYRDADCKGTRLGVYGKTKILSGAKVQVVPKGLSSFLVEGAG